MMDTILFYVHHTLTLLMGVAMSAAFCDIHFTKRNLGLLAAIFMVCGISQLSVLFLWGEQLVWELYPLIVHALLAALFCLVFRKHIITVAASIALAYLCCQPSKWFGLLTNVFTENSVVIWCVRIAVSLAVLVLVICFFAHHISEIFNKEVRSVLIFSSVPFVYYLFDYTVGIYTNMWENHARLVSEFLAFYLCVAFMAFCVIYYGEYEQKMQTKRKNAIIQITVQQQAKEIEAIRKSNLETSLLRHDMRLLLSNLALSIQQNDQETALNLISGYAAQVESASLRRYCSDDTVNYILTNFENKCRTAGVNFQTDLGFGALPVDEVMFASVLSNALDNALNAQADLPESDRQVKLLLKDSGGKLLLSVRNPFRGSRTLDPVTGAPVSDRDGHGYGTQSILYLTEKLGGKCQFTIEDHIFTLRIIL